MTSVTSRSGGSRRMISSACWPSLGRVDRPERGEQPGQVAPQIGVVVGDQNARATAGRIELGRDRRGFRVRAGQPAERFLYEQIGDPRHDVGGFLDDVLGGQVLPAERNLDDELRTLAERAVDADAPTVELHDLADQ